MRTGDRQLAAILLVGVMMLVPISARAQSSGDYDAYFEVMGVVYNIDPVLLESIATVESAGRAHAVSAKGAQGMMQLMPSTSRRFGVADPFDPAESVAGAARFLAYARERQAAHRDVAADLATLLASYNAGEGAVERHHGVPPYRETRQYITKVLLAYLAHGLDTAIPRPVVRPTAAVPVAKTAQLSPRPAVDSDLTVLQRLAEMSRARHRARAAAGRLETSRAK